jgi:hypothetical protein
VPTVSGAVSTLGGRSTFASVTPTVILRVIGAVAALVGGFAHLSLYNDGYDDIPSEFGGIGPFDIGDQFLLNTLGAIAIALGLVVPLFVRVPDLIWKLAAVGGIAWAAISLVASYFAKRTDGGWFDFVDQPGLKPAPEAALSVFSEIVVLVSMIILLALTARPRPATSQ